MVGTLQLGQLPLKYNSELLNAKVTVIDLILKSQLTENVIRESNQILFSEYKDRIEPLLVERSHLFAVLMAKR